VSGVYRTRSGDTWDVIAHRALGDERHMHLMLDANPEQLWVAKFDEGVELIVPNLPDEPLPSSLPPWRRP
jgi:phage tail protein X